MPQSYVVDLTDSYTQKLDYALQTNGTWNGVISWRVLTAALPAFAELALDGAWTSNNTQDEQWLQPFLEHGTVTKAIKVLDYIQRVHTAAVAAKLMSSKDGGSIFASAAARVIIVLERAAGAVATVYCEGGHGSGDTLSMDSVHAMLDQLTAESTWQALADVTRYVREKLWPAVADERVAAAPDGSSADLARAMPSGDSFQVKLGSDCGPAGAKLLCGVGGCLQDIFVAFSSQKYGSDVVHSAHGHPRLITALHNSGFMEGLCTAVLEAPPYTDTVNNYTALLSTAVWNLMKDMNSMVNAKLPYRPAYGLLLSSPSVTRMRWALLEQVAASAPGGAGELAAPGPRRDGQGQEGQRAEEAGCGGGTGVSGACWPVFQRQALRIMYGPRLQLTEALCRALDAAGVVDCHFAGATRAGRSGRPLSDIMALASRIVRALCARAEHLGESGAADMPGPRNMPRSLVPYAMQVQTAATALLRGATPVEVEACAPDFLAMHAWQLRLAVTPLGLADASPDRMGMNLECMMAPTAGTNESVDHPLLPVEIRDLWGRLGPAARAACAERLLPTRLTRSLDHLLRWLLRRDDRQDHLGMIGKACCIALHLVGPLLRAEQRPEAAARERAASRTQRAGAAEGSRSAGACTGAGGSGAASASSEADATSASGGSRVDGEAEAVLRGHLGMLVTLAKFLGGELAAGAGQRASAAVPVANARWLVVCAIPVGIGHRALEAVNELSGTSLGRAGDGCAAGLRTCRRLALEACALVCRSALPLMTRALEGSVEAMRGCADTQALDAAAGQADAMTVVGINCRYIADSLVTAARCVPPAELLPMQPQRLAAALAGVLQQAMRLLTRTAGGGRGGRPAQHASAAASQELLATVREHLSDSVLLLCTEDASQERCPGWLWARRGRREAKRLEEGLDLEALIAAAASPTFAPPRPVLVLSVKPGSPFSAWRWEEADRYRREVVALARELVYVEYDGLEPLWPEAMAQGAAGSGDGAGVQLWPPRLLRLCGNPRCGNFGGATEAELEPKQCGGCRAVRYCGAACQAAHWRGGHREECPEMAAVRNGRGSGRPA